MKRNTILTLFAAAVIAAMSITGCDSSSQEAVNEDATLDDGREYIKIFIDGKEFGYHFKLNDDDPDSFLVDEDGTVYPAKEGAESAAFDMVLDTLQ